MTFNQIILKNFFKNFSRYVLYFFSLIFSVTLFYSFILLATNEMTLVQVGEQDGGLDALLAGAVVILVIIVTFTMFANSLFIKRRNKEFALYKLIGMTDNKILRILFIENVIIYFGSVVTGILVGLLFSRLLNMILFRLMGIESVVDFQFSATSLLYTFLLFVFIFVILTIQNVYFIKRTKLITLMNLEGITETKYKRPNIFTYILGIVGFVMIIAGYFLSENLYDIGFEYPVILLPLMLIILFLTIVGAYFIFKFTVALILNMYRKSKKGHVNVNDVVATSTIMFKMKSNAFLLTLITTITAISLTAMSLAYISYYSAERMVESNNPYDYSLNAQEEVPLDEISEALEETGYSHEVITFDFASIEAEQEDESLNEEYGNFMNYVNIVSDSQVEGFDLEGNDGVMTGTGNQIEEVLNLTEYNEFTFTNGEFSKTINITERLEDSVIPPMYAFGANTVVVDDVLYEELVAEMDDKVLSIQAVNSINVENNDMDAHAIVAEHMTSDDEDVWYGYTSKIEDSIYMMQIMGLTVFIMGFIGLAFLVASGCILYFKQIAEGDDESGNFTILRKLGFTESELLRGVALKMLFSFGIPLLIGILHSIFAVRAGWFIFGTELIVPTITVIVIYTFLYSVFGMLSLLYYRKIIKESL
ncbi:MAG TPA: ABC transporter permease [Aliicoccus persicus]|uniref:ABC transporter permease n=1 Tax=Aliicoccus persicus TaxID=930138 RepID=A0A921DXE3_9STAP|nr:ABC transporter permease [Aliicoccus persicus]